MSDKEFEDAMKGVEPLAKPKKAETGKAIKDEAGFQEKRRSATEFTSKIDHEQSLFNQEMVLPHDIVGFKRPGVQEGVYRQFRLGKYGFDARLDLHGLKTGESAIALEGFIKEALSYELRSVLVVHGKGDRHKTQKALLKNLVIQWLKDMPEVLAYHSAKASDGGAGALYVLLRKSERAKQRNRDQFRLR